MAEAASGHSTSRMVEAVVARVARSEAIVRSQQRGEDELSVEDKEAILREVLQRNPATFLARFSKFLTEEDLAYFEAMNDSYEIKFYLKEARQYIDPVRRHRVVKNRRYECMRRLLAEGSYFSDRTLYHRHPLLFERYIGKFMCDEEKKALELDGTQQAECTLSSHILSQMEQERRLRLLEKQRSAEREDELACGIASTDEPMFSHASIDEGESENAVGWGEIPSQSLTTKTVGKATEDASEEEKALLRQELLSIVQQLFLSGQEKDFDYAGVDSSAEFDSLDTRQLDEEAAYFDSEEPCEALNDEEELAWLRSRAQRPRAMEEDNVMEFEEDERDDDGPCGGTYN